MHFAMWRRRVNKMELSKNEIKAFLEKHDQDVETAANILAKIQAAEAG